MLTTSVIYTSSEIVVKTGVAVNFVFVIAGNLNECAGISN